MTSDNLMLSAARWDQYVAQHGGDQNAALAAAHEFMNTWEPQNRAEDADEDVA